MVLDPSRLSTANHDLNNLQGLNAELKNAFQEQIVLNDEQEQEIKALKAKVSDFEARTTGLETELEVRNKALKDSQDELARKVHELATA